MLGRDSCGDWTEASSHEWLVTNGLGGYACGTVAGANTRRYHAFLMASLHPPVGRTLLVAKIDVSVEYLGQLYHLAANEFAGGAIDSHRIVCRPRRHSHLALRDRGCSIGAANLHGAPRQYQLLVPGLEARVGPPADRVQAPGHVSRLP